MTVPKHGAKLLRLRPERAEGNNISLKATADGENAFLLTADIEGEPDSTSYVQFFIDGKAVGSVKVGESEISGSGGTACISEAMVCSPWG